MISQYKLVGHEKNSAMILHISFVVLSFGVIAQGAPRIYGGHDAPNHKYPYQISIQDHAGKHVCSGSIINERWVLTVAHCLDNMTAADYKIIAGTNYLNETGTVYLPSFHIVHERYENFLHWDIAVIRVKPNIIFTDSVKPIDLPREDLRDYSHPAVFAGWGLTNRSCVPNVLQEIVVKVVTVKQCKEEMSLVNDAHVCTLNKFGEGACRGDSGGPLVIDDVQVGIASYARLCAVQSPDVYTRVWSYRVWIDSTLEKYDNIWG